MYTSFKLVRKYIDPRDAPPFAVFLATLAITVAQCLLFVVPVDVYIGRFPCEPSATTAPPLTPQHFSLLFHVFYRFRFVSFFCFQVSSNLNADGTQVDASLVHEARFAMSCILYSLLGKLHSTAFRAKKPLPNQQPRFLSLCL